MLKDRHSIQTDLQFLLKNGWKLVAPNTVQYEDCITDDIEKAARIFRAKLKLQEILEKKNLP